MVLGGARLPVPPPELLPGPDALPPAVLQQYVWLMERCWEASPADRPTFAAIAAQLRCGFAGYGGRLQRRRPGSAAAALLDMEASPAGCGSGCAHC